MKMASGPAWDLGEMRMAGSELDQIGDLYEQSARPRPTSTAFTPINSLQAPVQFINPQRTLYERDIFDVVGDVEKARDVPASIQKKRSRAQAKGRAVSLDPLLEYVDDGDLASHNNGNDFETAFPKTKKPTTAKRSKSTKSASNTLSSLWPDGGTQPPEMVESEQHGSHLSTLPESGQAKSKRATSGKARSSKPKMGTFKAPTLTKPTVVKQKEIIEEPSQSKPITYLGHTTTQQSVLLSQTTLGRLAAFQYIPPAPLQSSESSKSVDHSTQPHFKSHVDVYLETSRGPFYGDAEESYIHEDNDPRPSANYESYSEHVDEDVTKDVYENHAAFKDNVPEAPWTLQAGNVLDSAAPVDNDLEPAILTPEPSHAFGSSSQLQLGPQEEALGRIEHSDISTEQRQPYSGTQSNWKATQVQSARSSPAHGAGFSEAILPADMSDEVLANAKQSSAPSSLLNGQEVRDQEILSDAIAPENPKFDLEQLPPQVSPALVAAEHRSHTILNHVQVERSDIDEVALENGNMSKDYDSDNFDEGLNDSDLVELLSAQIVPGTQSDPVEAIPGGHGSGLQQQNFNGNYHDLKCDQAPAPVVPMLNTEDEFALEDEMEEEMMQLDFEVIECHQPPPSVQLATEGWSTRCEVFDKSLQLSSPNRSAVFPNQQTNIDSAIQSPAAVPELSMDDAEDLSFISSWSRSRSLEMILPPTIPAIVFPTGTGEVVNVSPSKMSVVPGSCNRRQEYASQIPLLSIRATLDDRHEYEPLRPFARPDFPTLIQDRSPVIGLSPQTFLRVCFRVAEMLKVGARCYASQENAIIELFARVSHSSRESGTSRQHFQFLDLWHERPPFPSGILANCKTPDLLRTESKVFIGTQEPKMARCLARLKRDSQSLTGWVLDIITIRSTDWEEVKWTKRIVSAGLFKSEKEASKDVSEGDESAGHY